MVFSSLLFLFIFLPASLLLYYICPGIRSKNIVLTILSLLFYAWGEPFWVILLIISAAVDYTNGRIIDKFRGKWQAKAAFIASLVINLSLLGVFKYGSFIVENINSLTGLALSFPLLTLPIGISFYTFQTMSYSIDVYRDKVPVQKSFGDFLLFVSLFPQLIAGPILRYSDIAAQLSSRHTTARDFAYGTTRFICGLGKKVLISNYASAVVDTVFTGNQLSSIPVLQMWLGIIMYAFHIYFDFSGYSDMAIGLGAMFGFKYTENFRYPYISGSITDFWRRWHISLSSFFRDYVYIPLGGNRRFQLRNMFIVWALTGLWHGASWNFVLWGLYFFLLLALEKYLFAGILRRLPGIIKIPWTFFLVLIGWVFFYFTNTADILPAFKSLFGLSGNLLSNSATRLLLINNLPLLIICLIGATPIFSNIAHRFMLDFSKRRIPGWFYSASAITYNTAMLFLCTVSLIGSTHNPFIYFRF